MILVDGCPLTLTSSSSSPPQEIEILNALMGDPCLLSSSHTFRDIPERNFTSSEESASESSPQPKFVYVFQREYATVDPAVVGLIGTDEATTCVGVAIRNRHNGMWEANTPQIIFFKTVQVLVPVVCIFISGIFLFFLNLRTSVAHMDSPDVVEIGIMQMLSLVVNNGPDTELDVHLIGGFEDASASGSKQRSKADTHGERVGYSLPLCAKIVESLWKRQEKFHIQTMFVLSHNTRRDAEGNAYPIFTGILVETATGSVFPASFSRDSRCPDEIVRRIRVTACNDDPSWTGRLLETYDTRNDKFVVASCCWSSRQLHIVSTLYSLSDPELLLLCSTSPFAEGEDFIDNVRRQWDYLIEHPDWRMTFPRGQPRVFTRTSGGGWTRCRSTLTGVPLSAFQKDM